MITLNIPVPEDTKTDDNNENCNKQVYECSKSLTEICQSIGVNSVNNSNQIFGLKCDLEDLKQSLHNYIDKRFREKLNIRSIVGNIMSQIDENLNNKYNVVGISNKSKRRKLSKISKRTMVQRVFDQNKTLNSAQVHAELEKKFPSTKFTQQDISSNISSLTKSKILVKIPRSGNERRNRWKLNSDSI